MAVSKIWPVRYSLKRVLDYAANPDKTKKKDYSDEQYQALADVLSYAENEEKTEREFYVEGINCNPIEAREQFVMIKQQYGKEDGIQAYHGYLSFKEQDITPELAQQVGMEFAQRVWGNRFQVVVTTHLNTHHLHCHFVINSVSFIDGKRLQNEEKAWIKFRHIADDVCQEFGLFYDPNPDYTKQNSYYYHREKAGIPTRYSMVRENLDEAIRGSRNKTELMHRLDEMGYRYQLSANRKYWTVIPKGYNKPIRLYKLGEEYSNEAIMRRLNENYDRLGLRPFQPAVIVLRQYRLPTREDKIKKVGGLYGLYLHYCYKLGYLPKYQQVSPRKLHYIFREDWLKLDKLTAQTRLLGRENISTLEQLFLYRAKIDSEINSLTADRKLLRNKIRTKIDDGELSEAKEQISFINERLKVLRRERNLCDGIAERSDEMSRNLATALADEEKTKTKEVKQHEQQR